jgi:diphosphomevalonate decarboxylase
MSAIRAMRAEGVPVFATMDAGPHVKAVCLAEAEETVTRTLRDTEGVLDLIVARPGPGLHVERLG